MAVISKCKALSDASGDHQIGCLPSAGPLHFLASRTGGEAIPGENDEKIIKRVKEKKRPIPKRTPHASLKGGMKRCRT
jgi:hypothetical protein